MSNQWGARAKFGVLGPSTNTVVEPDFAALSPPGVSNHYSRIFTPDAQALDNDSFKAGTLVIGENIWNAIDSVMTAKPDALVMGMSALTFYGGAEGGAEFKRRIEERSGLKVSTGSESLHAAMQTLGGIKRVAFLSPYYPVANAEVARFLTDYGYEVVREECLQCPSWTAIAETEEDRLIEVLARLDGDDVDALLQVGTNLSMMRLAAEKEAELGKPVIAINAATYWHALRAAGIKDRINGYGRLMAEF